MAAVCLACGVCHAQKTNALLTIEQFPLSVQTNQTLNLLALAIMRWQFMAQIETNYYYRVSCRVDGSNVWRLEMSTNLLHWHDCDNSNIWNQFIIMPKPEVPQMFFRLRQIQ